MHVRTQTACLKTRPVQKQQNSYQCELLLLKCMQFACISMALVRIVSVLVVNPYEY